MIASVRRHTFGFSMCLLLLYCRVMGYISWNWVTVFSPTWAISALALFGVSLPKVLSNAERLLQGQPSIRLSLPQQVMTLRRRRRIAERHRNRARNGRGHRDNDDDEDNEVERRDDTTPVANDEESGNNHNNNNNEQENREQQEEGEGQMNAAIIEEGASESESGNNGNSSSRHQHHRRRRRGHGRTNHNNNNSDGNTSSENTRGATNNTTQRVVDDAPSDPFFAHIAMCQAIFESLGWCGLIAFLCLFPLFLEKIMVGITMDQLHSIITFSLFSWGAAAAIGLLQQHYTFSLEEKYLAYLSSYEARGGRRQEGEDRRRKQEQEQEQQSQQRIKKSRLRSILFSLPFYCFWIFVCLALMIDWKIYFEIYKSSVDADLVGGATAAAAEATPPAGAAPTAPDDGLNNDHRDGKRRIHSLFMVPTMTVTMLATILALRASVVKPPAPPVTPTRVSVRSSPPSTNQEENNVNDDESNTNIGEGAMHGGGRRRRRRGDDGHHFEELEDLEEENEGNQREALDREEAGLTTTSGGGGGRRRREGGNGEEDGGQETGGVVDVVVEQPSEEVTSENNNNNNMNRRLLRRQSSEEFDEDDDDDDDDNNNNNNANNNNNGDSADEFDGRAEEEEGRRRRRQKRIKRTTLLRRLGDEVQMTTLSKAFLITEMFIFFAGEWLLRAFVLFDWRLGDAIVAFLFGASCLCIRLRFIEVDSKLQRERRMRARDARRRERFFRGADDMLRDIQEFEMEVIVGRARRGRRNRRGEGLEHDEQQQQQQQAAGAAARGRRRNGDDDDDEEDESEQLRRAMIVMGGMRPEDFEEHMRLHRIIQNQLHNGDVRLPFDDRQLSPTTTTTAAAQQQQQQLGGLGVPGVSEAEFTRILRQRDSIHSGGAAMGGGAGGGGGMGGGGMVVGGGADPFAAFFGRGGAGGGMGVAALHHSPGRHGLGRYMHRTNVQSASIAHLMLHLEGQMNAAVVQRERARARAAQQAINEMNELEERNRIDRENYLDSLPTFTFHPSKGPKENNTCAICLDEYQIDEELRTLPCFHMFHKNCFDTWARRDKSCPLCKLS